MKVNYTKKNIIHLIIYFVVIAILTMTVFFSITRYFKTHKITSLGYEVNSDVDYKVFLKDNDMYESHYLGRDMKYIANLIDYIDFDFKYNVTATDITKYDYSYYFEAYVNVYDKDKNLYEKTYKLTEPKKVKENEYSLNINENVQIKYSEYNDMIREFKKNYSLTSDSKLEVRMIVQTDMGYDKFEKTNHKLTDVVIASFPLTEQLVNISVDTNSVSKQDVINESSNHSFLNYAYLFVAFSMSIIEVFVIIEVFKYLYKLRPYNYEFIKYINEILKKYDRYIVNVKRLPNLSKSTIVDVTTIEEIVDARDSLQRPILYYTDSNRNKCVFIIINGTEAYRYTLIQSEFGKDNEKK